MCTERWRASDDCGQVAMTGVGLAEYAGLPLSPLNEACSLSYLAARLEPAHSQIIITGC